MADYKFKAFISYRHGELDSVIAARLQRALERFPVPAAIARRTGSRKVGRIFRDVEELASSSDLFTQLEQNIIDSEFLIVICSPRSRDAVWVHKEIETFLKYHDREHILAVLIKGEPNEAFPPQLLEEGEPLAFDLRSTTTHGSLKLCKKNLPRLVAPLIGCSYDDIYNRTRIYKLQRLTAVSALLMAASVAVGFALWRKNTEITRNYTAKLENQSRYLANTAAELLESGDRESALLVALSALPTEENARPYIAEARIALADALYLYKKDDPYQFRPIKILEHGAALRDSYTVSSAEGLLLSIDAGYEVYVWDTETLTLRWKLETGSSDAMYNKGIFPGNGTVILYNNERVDCFDMTGSEPLWSFAFPVCEQYHSESYIRSPDVSCTLDRTNGLAYFAPAYWNVEMNSEGRVMIPDAHCVCILSTADGSAELWRPESWYIGKSTANNGFCRDIRLSSDGTYCGMAVQQSSGTDSYSTEFLVFPVGESEAVFHTTIENGRSYATIAALEDGLASIAVVEECPAYSSNTENAPVSYTIYTYDMASDELLYSHSERVWATNPEPDIALYTLKRGNTFVVRCGNVILSLDYATGEVLQRAESESMQVGVAAYGSGFSIQFHSDSTVQLRSLTNDYFPSEIYSAYHRDLGLGRVKCAFRMNGRYYLFSGNGIYCYESADDDTFLFETELLSTDCAFSPAGGLFAMVNYSQNIVCVIDCEKGEELFRDECMLEYTAKESMLLWVDEGTLAYFAPDGTAVRLYNAADGNVREISIAAPDDYSTPVLSPTAGGGIFAVYYTPMLDWSQDETRLQRELVHVIDSADSCVLRSFTAGEIFTRYAECESNDMGKLLAATVTHSGRYVIMPNRLSVGEEETADLSVCIYDLQQDIFIPLCEDIPEIRNSSAFFITDGWISTTEDVFLLMETENEFSVVNAADGKVLQRYTAENLDGNEISFSADGQSVLFQDTSKRIHAYSREKNAETWVSRDGLFGWADFSFFEGGRYMVACAKLSMSVPGCYLYEKTGSGYELIDSISSCEAMDGQYVIISNGSSFTRVYRYLSLDGMISRAQEALNGRELTELEKQTYLVE